MKLIKNTFEKIEKLLHIIGYIAIFAMMILITLDTVGRYFFNNPIQGTYEITEIFLMIMVVFLTLSYSFKTGDHVRVDILYRRFPNKVKNAINVFAMFISAALFAMITYQGWILTHGAWINQEYTFGVITLPMYLSYIWIPLGSGALTLRLIGEGVKEVENLLKINSKEIVKEKVDESEELASSNS